MERTDTGERLREVVDGLGLHPVTRTGLDLEDDDSVHRWLVLACLLSGRTDPDSACRTADILAGKGLGSIECIAGTDPSDLTLALTQTRTPRPEAVAVRLVRVARGVLASGGSLAELAAECEGTQELGSRLVRLAPGLGAATVSGFLRPLRDLWSAAAEIPLHPAARAAALHLGLIGEGDDVDGEPGALRAALDAERRAPAFTDVEWALERLGRRSCARGLTGRCPLGRRCPVRPT